MVIKLFHVCVSSSKDVKLDDFYSQLNKNISYCYFHIFITCTFSFCTYDYTRFDYLSYIELIILLLYRTFLCCSYNLPIASYVLVLYLRSEHCFLNGYCITKIGSRYVLPHKCLLTFNWLFYIHYLAVLNFINFLLFTYFFHFFEFYFCIFISYLFPTWFLSFIVIVYLIFVHFFNHAFIHILI